MDFFRKLAKKFFTKVRSYIGYSNLFIFISNNFFDDRHIERHSSAKIEKEVQFGGDISLMQDSKIGRGSILTGEVNLERSSQIEAQCELHGNVFLKKESWLKEGCKLNGEVSIGKRTNLNENVEVRGKVKIGKYCAIARDVIFQQVNHQTKKPAMQRRFYSETLDSELETVSKGPIEVGNDVWIGSRAIILSGVTIGDGAVIGAGSVVTKDVEPYSIVAGVPAERKKWRFSQEVRNSLLELKWWDWEDKRLRDNKEMFESKITSVRDIETKLK